MPKPVTPVTHDLLEEIIAEMPEPKDIPDKRGRVGKSKGGRPPSPIRKARKQKEYSQEFIENFQPIRESRPEPLRLVKALSLPEDQQQYAIENALNPRQLAFCREYVVDFNATQAAIRAGYGMKNAQNQSFGLLSYRSIRKLIDIYTQSNASKVTIVDKDYIIQKVTEIVTTASKDSDKLRGLELLARHLGMFVDRTEISGKDGEAIKIEETRKEADDVARKLRTLASKPNLRAVN